MTNYPQHSSPQPNVQAKTRNNKKLWIVGSIIGVLVIVMGGCVACGALIALSRLNEDRGSASNSSPSEEAGMGALAATSWTGTYERDQVI